MRIEEIPLDAQMLLQDADVAREQSEKYLELSKSQLEASKRAYARYIQRSAEAAKIMKEQTVHA